MLAFHNKHFYTFGKDNHQLLHKIFIMKRVLLSVIFSFALINLFGQWNTNYNIDQKCMHIPQGREANTLAHIYDWQNDHLNDYDVKFYWLDIEVSNTSTFVSGNTTINAESVVAIDTFAFELLNDPDIYIDSIFVDGTQYLSYTWDGDNVLVPVSNIPSGTPFSAKIYYHGDPGSVGFLSGLTNAYNETYQKHVTWSLSEPFGAKSWFPVKQDLEDKADSCWVFLTTDSTNMAGSEGLLTNVADLGNGKSRYEWKCSYPIDYYLISFAVADYQEYNTYAHPDGMNGDSLLIQNFIYDDPGCLAANKAGMDAAAEMIELYSDLYILYPFHEEKYGHCLTQLGGGMEHQTMTTLGGFGFGLVSHEMGHMWFGDNVTCATWSDIWINEGFATYSNFLCEEYIHGWESGKAFIKSAQNSAMSQPGGSTYIPEELITEPNQWRIFDGRLSYNKGAAIIHTLRHEIQDDTVFFNIMKTFQNEYTGSTATGEDFKTVAEDVSGMDFEQFFDQWYYGQGYPTYDIEYYMMGDSLHMTVTQTTSTTATPLFVMLMDYKLYFNDGTDTTVRLMQTANLNEFSVYTGKDVTNIDVDPEEWTMEKVGSISVMVEESESPVYFTIGPNPVKESMNVYFLNTNKMPKQISISDLSGKVVYTHETSDNQLRINTSGLAYGVYFIRSNDGSNNMIRKFVK